ncbi:MAG: FprA family A-type flavoprotein [Oscillospiraceae bacterium]|jgi:flavorubredoxin|nr:FprA family A-type flavoprotein [Oscillospiraceae bacterium]MCI1991003.1 FprA family A-type flavoprotein [Oscillospiraceae bacterium]MCI2036260.1 FprA family A-type flavoprotein [Oscillospiraceae bacterium]
MHCVRKVTDDLYWVGADDHRLALFENIHPIPRGISYNSYLLLDRKTVLFDTVDWASCRQFLENVAFLLGERQLDYLVVNHVEPDHAGSVDEILLRYPDVKIISTEKAFRLLRQFGFSVEGKTDVVKEGDVRSFGKHSVTFVEAPMVHWPEVMVTFDTTNGVLFSADAFGTFGALNGKLFNDEVDFDRDWLGEARRYYTNIVGKYGPNVQRLLKKAAGLDIKMICPLHGPVWRSDLGCYLDKYDRWSRYEPEERGILIVYASMYGDTESAAEALAAKLVEKGIRNVEMFDVSGTHVSYLISETFRLSHLVLASVTYNMGIYPPMHNYLMDMRALNLQNRTVAIVENGSWACAAGRLIRSFLEEKMKNMKVLDEKVSLRSAMTEKNVLEMDALADKLARSVRDSAQRG